MRFRRQPPREPDVPPADDSTAETVVEDRRADPVVEETEYVPPRRRPPTLWPWLVLLALLVVGGIVAAILLTRDNGNDKHKAAPGVDRVAVPNVVGRDAATAATRLDTRGLKADLRSRTSSKPAGTVVAQRPRAGRRVPRGAVVTVFVSHLATVAVPNVVGMQKAAAVARLKAAGLTSRLVSVRSTKPAGTVVTERPGAGSNVAKGSTVELGISRGLGTVPDVVGDSAPTAKRKLKAAGFVPVTRTVTSADQKNVVTAQNPPGGRRFPKGSSVRINVSNGRGGQTTTSGTTTSGTTTAPATTKVPNVRGLDVSPAQRRIRAAGLRPVVRYVSSAEPQGRVVAQSPPAGTTVRRDSLVRLSVSSGPNPGPSRTVPDVVGLDEGTATQTLQDAGFRVESVQVNTFESSDQGVVLNEQPSGGSRAPQGALVTIYVGNFTG